MKSPPRIVTLNLGSQTVALADFRRQPHGGLLLHAFRLRELPGDAHESARHAQIAAALPEMLAELHIKNTDVNYAIPAQAVFVRFVKLPAVEEEKIERLIGFEAQQNVPFPLGEVVWDYQLVGGGGEEQIQVVIVAIKADLIEGINAAVESAGLRPSIVGLTTMALYNAFRYNYSELSGCSVLVDLGARTTTLLFIEPGKIFSRSVPIGGGSISAAIAKEFAEPLAAAELRKKRDGFVGLGPAHAGSPAADVARVSRIVRGTMTRLHAELMRSVSHYRAQQQGSAPERVFLCGGVASTPYVREFFHEKLQLPIELFNPVRNVAAGADLGATDLVKSAHLLGELVGLALRSTATCPMELTLRPPSVVRAHALKTRRPYWMVAAACFVLGLLAWAGYYARAASVAERVNQRIGEKVDGMRRIAAQIDAVRKQTNSLDNVADPIATAVHDRNFWPELLEDLNARLPAGNIWITELIATSGGKPVGVGNIRGGRVEALAPNLEQDMSTPVPRAGGSTAPAAIDGIFVRGLYLSNPRQQEVVVDYFRNLIGSPFFTIDPNNQSKALKPTTPNNTEWAFPYELRLELKKPVKLR
ncbi:MAG: type IV pilus assembly protein PilM [Chthoniobacterales bacterium]